MPLVATLLSVTYQRPLSSFVIKGPAVVVLLKEGCPCVQECNGMLNALADACTGKVKFVGIVDASATVAKSMAEGFKLKFPLVPDPKLARIRSLQGRSALDLRLLDKEGKVVGRWNGLSRGNVLSLSRKLNDALRIEIAFDTRPFTVLTKYGCDFQASSTR